MDAKDLTLIAKDLTKYYVTSSSNKKRALYNFSIKVGKGEVFGLLGPNGAGKTTFLNIITKKFGASSGSFTIPKLINPDQV